MPKTRRYALIATFVFFIASSSTGTAGAAGFNQFVVFGDSTLDTGYFRYHTSGNPQFDGALDIAIQFGATGGWAGNGVMNTTILADKFGLSAAPCDAGGSNYANGGATTMNNTGCMVPDNIFTIQQIENYLATVHGAANRNALYLIKTGDNDATYVNGQTPEWRAANPNYLDNVAAALAVEVTKLQVAGARTIVVRNSYDSALFAARGGDIAPENFDAYTRSYGLGISEWSDLAALGVHFVPADNDSLFRYVAHHPELFGFTKDTVLSTDAPFYTNPRKYTACMCILTPEEQRDYLFVDGVHLTTAGQTIEADYTYSLLVAPSEISLLAQSAVQSGWARAATIQGQIDTFGQHRGPNGVNVWTSAGVSGTEIRGATGFVGDSGDPFGGTVGLDFQTPCGAIVGVAFTAGSQRQGFSTGGHFDQTDETPSLYAAYADGPLWGNVVASYGVFQDKIARSVQLGIFTDQNNGNTVGQSMALALRGGDDVNLGRFTTGPVAGVVLQQVRVDGFTETGTSGVTALSFGNQTRGSAVTQLGWRVSADLGDFRPFAEMDWNHEWTGKDHTITTTLTSFSCPSYTPTYTMDGAPVVSDWATLSLGSYYRLSPRVMLRGAASAMFFDPQLITYGGEVGMNVCF